MSNYHSNYHDPMRQYSSASYTTNTDKTLFLTPYNQSIVSRSSASQDKSEKPERGSSKTKLTPDILRAITKIDNLSHIVEINLDGNSRHLKSRLKAISGLHSLMNLKELILSNNDIEKIENLNHLKNLHVLNLSFNKITKIENISVLKQLQVLDLSNNLIEEIPALISKNINLVDLNLANNLLSDKSSIMNLKPLPKLAILDLTNNPIREIPGYPTFIYHLLKKLCKLDSKMTPNFSKAQANNYLTQTSKYSSLGGLPNEHSKNSQEEEEIPPEPEHDENEENERKISYEQRLLATQNRLNELNILSNRVRLLSAEDINSNKYLKIPQKEMTSENNKSTEQKNSTFLVNENTLYSVSESVQDTRLKSNPMGEDTLDMHVNSYKDVSANMKLLDLPSPQGQTQGTVEGWNFSVQTPPPNSGMHRGGFFGQGGENKMENTLRPSGIMTNLINMARLSRGGLEDTNEQQQQQPSTVKKGQGGRAPETGEIAERIQGLQSEIEQRISNYDRITNTFNTRRQDVSNKVKSLDEVIQNILLSTGGMKMNNNNSDNVSPLLNEQTEMLNHVRDVLDLIEYQSENHMNYLLMLNHIHSKLEGEGSKNIKSQQQNEEALTVEDIDLTFTVLTQRIDEISSRLETLYTHIYRIISKFNNSNTPKKFSKPSPKNSLFSNIEAQFKDLSMHVDSLIKEEQTRTKTFTGLRGLYTNMWRLTKSLVQIWKQEATLDMESHLIGKTSFADFLFTSPKEPLVDNFTSPQHVGDFAGIIAAESTVRADKENWGLASPDPVMGFGASQDNRRSSINDRALRNLNTEESDRASSKAGKLTPVSDLLRGQSQQLGSKSPISQGQNYNRTSRTEFSARENIRSARDNKSMMYEKGGLMRHSSKFPDDFAFPTISDHGENASPKDGSFSRNVSGINRRESGHTNEILRGFSYLSSHRGTLQNEGNKPEKPCINCAAKDSAVKFAQDEMLKAQREKLTLEMELGRLRSEIIGIQKTAENEIARARSESIQLASIQDREKEEYSTALILLSEICNHNSTKLDEIRLRMLSMMEQNVADSSNPLKWLVKMQSSTVEDLIKANNEMQDRTKSILTDFQTLFKEKTPRNDSLYAIKDHIQLTQQSTRRDDSHARIPETAIPTQEEPMVQSTREDPVFQVEPIEISKAFEQPQEHEENNIFEQNPTPTLNAIQIGNDSADRDSFRPRLEAPMLQKLKKHNSETDLRKVSSAAKENSIEGSLYQPVRAFHEIKESRNNKPKQASSFHMDQASLFPQFTLDMKPMENLANGQITFNKNSVRESENNSLGNTNLNQILFGCNGTETISELSRPVENPSNIHLPSESDLNAFQSSIKDSTPTTLTAGGFSPFQSYKFMQYAKISGNTLSNLQENIAQHLIKNEKGDAGKHLKKINNNIHQYKGMRERVAEVIGRRSIKPSESTQKKSRTAGTSTPVNQSASKYSSPSIASNRRATLDVKTPRAAEQQPKEYASVRHNVGVNRGQFKYNNVFRKPSNYPTTTGERGVNVNLKNFLSEGKRVLESPDVTNYHEKFDISSPYHPVYSSHGSQGMRVSDSVVGSQVNSVGRMSLGLHPVERNMHL